MLSGSLGYQLSLGLELFEKVDVSDNKLCSETRTCSRQFWFSFRLQEICKGMPFTSGIPYSIPHISDLETLSTCERLPRGDQYTSSCIPQEEVHTDDVIFRLTRHLNLLQDGEVYTDSGAAPAVGNSGHPPWGCKSASPASVVVQMGQRHSGEYRRVRASAARVLDG